MYGLTVGPTHMRHNHTELPPWCAFRKLPRAKDIAARRLPTNVEELIAECDEQVETSWFMFWFGFIGCVLLLSALAFGI